MTAPTNYDLAVALAASEIIVGISPAIVPQTTVASPGISVGATSVTLTSTAGFIAGGILTFWDATFEPPLPILSIVGNVVSFGFNGVTVATESAHVTGALVATNVMDDLPLDTSDMRESGFPVISCFPVKRKTGTLEVQRDDVIYPTLQVVYQLLQKQPQSGTMHPALWLRQQSHRIVTDLQAIYDAFESNRRMVTSQQSVAISLLGFDHDLRVLIGDDAVPYYRAAILIQLKGRFVSSRP